MDGFVEQTNLDEATVQRASDALSLLGEPTRLQILLTLATQSDAFEMAQPLTFSELRHAVGVEDTGRFNYHLRELTDRFVTKDDDTYRITATGLEIVSLVVSGLVHEEFEPISGETDYDCVHPSCDNSLEASFDGRTFSLACPDDEHSEGLMYMLPPSAAADRSIEDLARVAIRTISSDMEKVRTRRCPFCESTLALTVPVEEDSAHPDIDEPLAHLECSRCWMTGYVPIGLLLVRHPAIIALYQDHGRDVREAQLLSLPFVSGEDGIDIRSTNPVRIDVIVEFDGESTTLTFDEDLSLVNST